MHDGKKSMIGSSCEDTILKRYPRFYALLLMVVVLGFMLQACGYHLKGAMGPLSPLPPTMVVGSENTPLNSQMLQVLKDMETPIVNEKSLATLILNLSSESKARRVLSVNSEGKAEEYELNYSFTYSVTDNKNKILVSNQIIRRLLAIQFNSEQVNSIVSEAEQLFQDMRQAAVQDLARRLQRFSDNRVDTQQ